MTDNPFPVRLAQETAQTIRQLSAALEDAARVLLAGKRAAGRVAEAEAQLATARAETEAAQRERASVAADAELERARLSDAIAAEAATERVRIARAIEAERLALTRLGEHRAALEGALQAEREAAAGVRATLARDLAHAQTVGEAAKATLAGELRAAQGQVADWTQRVEAKRKEYRALLDQAKAVIRA